MPPHLLGYLHQWTQGEREREREGETDRGRGTERERQSETEPTAAPIAYGLDKGVLALMFEPSASDLTGSWWTVH